MRPIRMTVNTVSVSTPVPLDQYIAPFSVSIGVAVTGTISYTVEYTYDDVWSPTFSPASATWYAITALTTQTTSKDAALSAPVAAVRLNVGSVTGGSATMTVTQAGQVGG